MDKKITSREKDYSKWYLDVIQAADLVDNSPVRGCMVIKPEGYAIWENIQKTLDGMFKEKGVKNAYFPLFIPKSFFEKEAKHVEGFAKECAIVTHHRLKEENGKLIPDGELDEPLIVRPTSETIIYDTYSRWIESYKDLPLLINQWANVVRWEMRTRPFLRTTEFLWQEGHTAHASEKEASEMTLEMIGVYKKFAEDYLAMPVISGFKSESEKFAGAVYTTTVEAMMQDGKALQSGTSHMLGQNFAKAFDVKFSDSDGKEQYAWQTSWGLSTRIIGGLIMTHSDDKGLVLPPKIAPVQAVIVPIWDNEEDKKAVMSKTKEMADSLRDQSITIHIDDREGRPGPKFYEWEKKGVPVRIEIGPKDVAKNTVVVVRRDTGEKEFVSDERIGIYANDLLETIQNDLYKKALDFRSNNTHITDDWDEFKNILEENPGFIRAHWCGSEECEAEVQRQTKATIRCIPFDEKELQPKI
ncbi:MAG: Proline-tRNA ligase [candidate division CPR2 bacterium GW2011_GWD2_39_7]|nr:MAG: Proline-tRNA ligase [candidate division CPR2 bacterium GW2011_GWD2_39_7]